MATATFGVGFFMRPVGGILLGIYADRRGRKAALQLIIAMMTVAIALIAFAPHHTTAPMSRTLRPSMAKNAGHQGRSRRRPAPQLPARPVSPDHSPQRGRYRQRGPRAASAFSGEPSRPAPPSAFITVGIVKT